MKKQLSLILILGAAVLMTTGCGSKRADSTTLTVSAKGGITLEEVMTDLGGGYYDEDELKAFAKEMLDGYEGAKINAVSLKDGTGYVKSTYSEGKVYQKVTGYDFYMGTILSARAAGYDFKVDMSKVKDGVLTEEDVLGTSLPSDSKCIIVEQFGTVCVPGTVTYVSNKNAAMSGENVMVIEPEDESKVLVYIIYQ